MEINEIWDNRENPKEMEKIIKSGVPCYKCCGFATQDSNLQKLTTEQALALLPNYSPSTMLNSIRATDRDGTIGVLFEELDTSDLF